MKTFNLTLLTFAFLISTQAKAESDWYSDYLSRVTATQEEQPHWMTPVFTTTARLEQEFRTDLVFQKASNGNETVNYGNGKGLELIPFERVEIILGVPPYIVKNTPKVNDSFGDMPTLIKYRILSENSAGENYILTGFLGTSLPVGASPNGGVAVIVTPSIAGGKGWGDFDVQSTLGIALPLADVSSIGQTLQFNTAFQYHLEPAFWPQLEFNLSHFSGSKNNGLTQAFISPGIIFGRFPIHNRTAFAIGVGYQIAVTTFHTYNDAVSLTMRLPF